MSDRYMDGGRYMGDGRRERARLHASRAPGVSACLFWPVCVCDRYLGGLGRVLVLILHTPLCLNFCQIEDRPRR